MLFTSYEFIWVFLPVVFGVFCFLCASNHRLARAWLILASLFFYVWWNPKFVFLLLASVGVNFVFGVLIGKARPSVRAKYLLAAAVTLNLCCLGYFKYADFFIGNYNHLAHGNLSLLHITLPLGISFYTFTQIAFLVDVYRGVAVEFRLENYALFVTYFPHLIAGPILHHKQMMPQFAEPKTYQVRAENLVLGFTFFCIGLSKKLLLADHLSGYADASFGVATQGPVYFLTAWIGALAYTFQLYFDFSGYCDMAIGISRLFGIQLPINFDSPYKATSIIDFWRRWHITLSNFLRDYVYISLGGNRKGKIRRHANLLTTMFLGGLWHGANWTFVVWGSLHGVLLVINHLWNELRGQDKAHADSAIGLLGAVKIGVTFLAVAVLWVLFRAPTFVAAEHMLLGMVGATGMSLPPMLEPLLRVPLHALHVPGLVFNDSFFLYPVGGVPHLGEGQFLALLISAMILAFFCPNSQEIVARLAAIKSESTTRLTLFHGAWGTVLGLIFFFSLVLAGHKSDFIYFQF